MNYTNEYGTNLHVMLHETIPSQIRGKNFNIIFRNKKNDVIFQNSKEIVIQAISIVHAQSVFNLVISAKCVLDGSALIEIGDMFVYPIDANSREKSPYETIFSSKRTQMFTPGFVTACKLAAKASFRKANINALNKYMLSCHMHANDWIDLDPTHSQNIPLSPFPYDYLRYGYAIFIAYSIIEELKLEIRASSDKPSKIKGKWNPIVRQDLEARLATAKINFNEPFLWQRRGSIKKLEQNKPISPLSKAPWAFGNVRDCDILLIDAINNVSWLRSKIAAHKVDKAIYALSVYDVSNAQSLARRLVLESLGFWDNRG